MPLYQLLGGKVRQGADCYFHASGASFAEVEEAARAGMERGFRHVRVQVSDARLCELRRARHRGRRRLPMSTRPSGRPIRAPSGSRAVRADAAEVLRAHARKLGDEVELLHDVHERVTLNEGINLCKALEPYRLFFLEDPFPPEENDHFRLLRQQSSIPIAMGELFNTQHETCRSSRNG